MYNKTIQNIYDGFARQCNTELREKLHKAKQANKDEYVIEEINSEGSEDCRLSYLHDGFDALTSFMNFSSSWETWQHKNLNDTFECSLNNLNGDSYNYINGCADKYFMCIEFRSDELDWLYLEVLLVGCYKNYQKNEQLGERLLEYFPTIKKSVNYFIDEKYIQLTFTLLFSLAIFLVKLLVVGVLLYEGRENYALGALGIIFVLIYFYNINKNNKRITDLMDATNNELQAKLTVIKKVYSLLSTKNIHWDILEDEVNNARHEGIEIPSAIFTAIKQHKLK